MPDKMTIGVVAPAARIEPALAERLQALVSDVCADGRAELRVHPQCFRSAGHFAGSDDERSAAFLEYANDPEIDAIWFARGGYGSCRLSDSAFTELNDHARAKTYLGYSDTGTILARLYAEGIGSVVHGPMPSDLNRERGEIAVLRSLKFLVDGDRSGVDPCFDAGVKAAAFNLTILAHLLAAPWAPDLTGHVVAVEDVSEYMYRIDRAFFSVMSSPKLRGAKGLRLGRIADVLENDTADFVFTEEEIAKTWCERAGVPYLGRADIGHDAENKIVPFGAAGRA